MKSQLCLTVHEQAFESASKSYRTDWQRAKSLYYNNLITEAASNQATLFKIADKQGFSQSPVHPSIGRAFIEGWYQF